VEPKKSLIAIALTTLGAGLAQASTTPITVTDTVSLGQLLSGNGATLQFDINAALAAQGASAEDIVSGNLIVYGVSDPSYQTTDQTPGPYQVTGTSTRNVTLPYTYYTEETGWYSYSCGLFDWSTCYSSYTYYIGPFTGYYAAVVTDTTEVASQVISNTDNVTSTMQISAGASTANASDSLMSSSTSEGPLALQNTTGSEDAGYTYYYIQETDTYQAISGPITDTLSLNSAALSELTSSGQLNVGISALSGQFDVGSMELDLLVPEPGTGSLVVGAIAAMALVRRRKQEKENAANVGDF
jgi:hypothetical protein